MKKGFKTGLISIILMLILFPVIQYFAKRLMQKEDFQIDMDDLEKDLQSGDIIFQTSTSIQSKAIQLGTNSRYSHMGMICQFSKELNIFVANHKKTCLLQEIFQL